MTTARSSAKSMRSGLVIYPYEKLGALVQKLSLIIRVRKRMTSFRVEVERYRMYVKIALAVIFIACSSLSALSQSQTFPKPSNESHPLFVLSKQYLDRLGDNVISCKASFSNEGALRFVEVNDGGALAGDLQFSTKNGLRTELLCQNGRYSSLSSGSQASVVRKWLPNDNVKKGTSESIKSATIGQQVGPMTSRFWPAWLDFIVNTDAYLYFDPITVEDGRAKCSIRAAGSNAILEVVFRETSNGIEVLSITTRVDGEMVNASSFENVLVNGIWLPTSGVMKQGIKGFSGEGRITFAELTLGAPRLSWQIEFEDGVLVKDEVKGVTYTVGELTRSGKDRIEAMSKQIPSLDAAEAASRGLIQPRAMGSFSLVVAISMVLVILGVVALVLRFRNEKKQ